MRQLRDYIAGQPMWACEPSRLEAFLQQAQEFAPPTAQGPADDIDKDFWEMLYPPLPKMMIDEKEGVAIIPVVGVVSKGLPMFLQRAMGMCDVGRISTMVDVAMESPMVKRVEFHFDSPGGSIAGLPELSEKIAALTAAKPTLARTEDMMCSAAYWLAAMCSEIHVAPSSIIGSIGVYRVFHDFSAMADKVGIKVQVFRSGMFKGAGVTGTSLTEAQAQQMQESIDQSGAEFRSLMKQMRPQIQDEAMQGQWFYGKDSIANGIADRVLTSRS